MGSSKSTSLSGNHQNEAMPVRDACQGTFLALPGYFYFDMYAYECIYYLCMHSCVNASTDFMGW